MSSNPFNVRVATVTDVDRLRAVVPAIIAETHILPPSPQRIEALISRCCNNVGGSIAGIIDGEVGEVAASVGLTFAEDIASDVPYITAVWCGLTPTARHMHRGVGEDDPRRHYGKRLFEFARWCHKGLEQLAQHPIVVRFDVLTTHGLEPKMRWYQRNVTQVGASFAFGAVGRFKPQAVSETEIAA